MSIHFISMIIKISDGVNLYNRIFGADPTLKLTCKHFNAELFLHPSQPVPVFLYSFV